MAVYQDSITLRDTAYSSVASIIAAFNKLEEAILGCGMVRASAGEDSGQAGTWVSGTPGTGETQVVNGPSGSSGHMTSQGYKTYKLPDSLASTNPVLVRCFFCVAGTTTVNQMALATFAVKIGSSGWSPSPSVNVPGAYIIAQWSNITLGTTYIPLGSKGIVASCGEGYFWLAVEGAGVNSSATGNDAYPLVPGANAGLVGVAVLRPRILDVHRPNELLLLAPPLISVGSGGFSYFASAQSSPTRNYGLQAFRFSDGAWNEINSAPFSPLQDVMSQGVSGVTRVGIPTMVFNGVMCELDAAFVPYGSVPTNGQLVDVDLKSTGAIQCRVSYAFPDCCPYKTWQAENVYKYTRSMLLLPWETP